MIVPMKKERSPWWNAARRRIGVPMIAPTSPIPWLIPFATSSPYDCGQLRKGSDSSMAFIDTRSCNAYSADFAKQKIVARCPALAQFGSLCSLGNMLMLPRACTSKFSTAMARYPDDLSLRTARALFFRDAKLGLDGGYGNRWVRVETKLIPFYFPNWPSRVAAARLHDLQHVAAEYGTDWSGEGEIAAWEIASGCAGYHAAWLWNLGVFGAGLLVAPRRVFHAFLRGRRAKTNLYKNGIDESRLDQMTVGMLRDELGLRASITSARSVDFALFGLWCIPSILVWLPLPFLVLVVLSLIVRARYRTA